MAVDHDYMGRALRLAHRGLYTTDPNPRVGCVIVDDKGIAGEGWHQRAGGPHAEIHALRRAGERARGATAYVTLEPCSHHGRTPPCADALVEAGVHRVVAAMADPNPLVSGNGFRKLREAGVAVKTGVLEAQAKALNPGFIKRMSTGKPYVRVKLAMSLDGRTAMADGESQWITSAAAREDVQKLRARSSAVMTGIGTVLHDNPSLNVRLSADALGTPGAVRQPLRVVLDSQCRFPRDAGMLKLDGNTLLLTSCENTESWAEKLEVVQLPAANGRVDLPAAMDLLAQREINEIQVEAGAVLNGALLEAGLVDEIIIYMAPHLMGDNGRGLFHLPALRHMDQRIGLQITDIRAVGQDWRISAIPKTALE